MECQTGEAGPDEPEGGRSGICNPLSCFCRSFLACLALHQVTVSISLAQPKSLQGQDVMIVATATTSACPDVQASLLEGSRPDTTMCCWRWRVRLQVQAERRSEAAHALLTKR